MYKNLFVNGYHKVLVTETGKGVSEGKKVPFYCIKFENEDGHLIQRFYDNEIDRKKLIVLLKEFNLEPASMNSKNIKWALDEMKGKTLYINVYTNEKGYQQSFGWKRPLG